MENWLIIWLAVALIFAVGEMTTPGSFFMLPFAIGALVAAAVSLLEPGLVVEASVFVVVSGAVLPSMRRLAKRLDQATEDQGIGSRRLIGQTGIVTKAIPADRRDLGIARVQREDWRAESVDGAAIPAGATVRVAEIEGTRVLVALIDAPDNISDPDGVAEDDLLTPDADPPLPS